jgi:integrase/recombinase XerD
MLIYNMGLLRFELKSITPEAGKNRASTPVSEEQVLEFLALRKIQGICDKWLHQTSDIIRKYLSNTDYVIDKPKTLEYIQNLKDNYSLATYRKRTYAIRKFLYYLKIEWADNIQPPPEQIYKPIYVPKQLIENALEYFRNSPYYLQERAIILLGMDSGMRAEELYQLTLNDIDMDNRTIHIIHNPRIGKTTKTKASRISFFTPNTRRALQEYIEYYNNGSGLKELFGQSHLMRMFRPSPIRVKLLRKYFSQEWDRRGGQTSIKKILMGHSLKGDVDLSNYNAQSPEDLKRIYDKVMQDNVCKTVK